MFRYLASFLFAGLGALLAAQADSVSPPVLGKLVDVAGTRVHIYCTGNGSPAVVVASGGFSFDWALVQPKIAQITRICTYDTAGTAWSDPVPVKTNPACAGRVDELHQLLINAGVKRPYVLVGYSIGGLIVRLYAARYQNEVSGLVFVDHAFIDTPEASRSQSIPSFKGLDSPPVLIFKSPIALDLEDDQNFSKLPEPDQKLHRWALAYSLRPTPEMAAVCFSEVEEAEQNISFPLGDKPVAVVSTSYNSPQYAELQHKLLMLSRNSKQFKAQNSSHMVIIDQPDTVLSAIRHVVAAIRGQAHFDKR
jgi:pimeloyl-ACP methyl ester carboxylesterase